MTWRALAIGALLLLGAAPRARAQRGPVRTGPVPPRPGPPRSPGTSSPTPGSGAPGSGSLAPGGVAPGAPAPETPAAPDSQGGSVVVNVTPAFRPGPYTALAMSPSQPEAIAVGTADGHVLWSYDGGATGGESHALSAREYLYMTLRSANFRHREYAGLTPGRGALRLFLNLLSEGLPVTRWAAWMSVDSPRTDITALASSPDGGRILVATPQGLWKSDERRGVWSRSVGTPRPKGQDVVGLAVAIDPEDPTHVLAGTSVGLLVSQDGGRLFRPHADRKLAGEEFRRFVWDPGDAEHVLAVTSETVYQSKDRGATFQEALSAGSTINALALAPEGAYVATQKGLMMPTPDGGEKQVFKDESVIGVVPLGDGWCLAATELGLFAIAPSGARATILRTTATDPVVALVGTPSLAWLLTRYGIFRIGAQEARGGAGPVRPAHLRLSLEDVERAVLARLGIGGPQDTRLADRWYAKLLPTVTVRLKGVTTDEYSILYDSTFPISYRLAQSSSSSSCCGIVPGDDPYAGAVVILAQWDLSRVVFGQVGNSSNPWGMIESNLRPIRDNILREVRWRYRESAYLATLLEHPPKDARVAYFWRLKLEEYAAYLEGMSGQKVVPAREWEELR